MKKKKQKTKKTIYSNFIAKCAKAKGWDLTGNLNEGESYVESVLRQPCYYPTLIEFIGEESVRGNLNLEEVQDEMRPEMIEELLRVVFLVINNSQSKNNLKK